MSRTSATERARDSFLEAMSRIASFWGAPSALGAIYGAVYLSKVPIALGDLVVQAGVSKGAVSLHARALERLGLVRRVPRRGDRKDYYEAEPDFWRVVRSVLRERQHRDFDRALAMVRQAAAILEEGKDPSTEARFVRERIGRLISFFNTLDQLVSVILALDELRSEALAKLLAPLRSKP